MAKLSINETTTFRWTFEEDVARYSAAGVPAIGVWRQKLSDCGLEKAIELLEETGLEVAHLMWAGGFTGSDGRSYRASVEDALSAVRTAEALKTHCLIVYSGPRAGHTFNHARRLAKDALGELAPLAEELGVLLAVEPMHPCCAREFTSLNTIDEVMDLIASVGSPTVKLVYDTYHLGQNEGCLEQIPAIADHVALVQLGDARAAPTADQDRCRLGEGVVPLKEIVAILREAGYDGYYDVELLGEEIETIEYSELIEHAKQAFGQLVGW